MSSRQIVLISGCSSGIGLATAVFLAKDAEKRFKVYATMRNLAKKGQLEEEGKEYLGDTLVVKQMDVCSDESVQKAVKEVLDTEGRIDVLFNNAGVSLLTILDCLPMELAKETFDINFFGTLRLINAVLPSMKARESGHIINNSSVFGVIGAPFFEVYCASKFAVEGLTESLVPTLKHFNIRCTLLEPGPVSTSIGDNNVENTKGIDLKTADQKTQDLWVRMMERMGPALEGKILTPQAIAEVVQDIILSDKGQFRYLPNEGMFSEEITARFADATGGTFMQLEKMAKTAEEQEHQAWCELPFRQLAYNFATNTFGEESVDTMSSADKLIVVFLQTGFAAKAQEIGKDLLEKKEKKFGKDHLNVAITLTNLGSAHGDLGNCRQKKDLLERALRIMEQHYGKDHPEVAVTLAILGSAHESLGNYRQQKDLLERALIIEEQHYGVRCLEWAANISKTA